MRKLVVVGNGMVGHRFVEHVLATPDSDGWEVTVFAEEPRHAYDRVHLSDYFDGASADALALGEAYPGICTHLSEKVERIDRRERCVVSTNGRRAHFDALVLATGSYPFVPPIPGRDRQGCFVYRTIEDLEAIRAASRTARVGVVVGGGLLGLEAANALRKLGLETHVVEFADQLMGAQLDPGGGNMLRGMVERLGVAVHLEKATERIDTGTALPLALHFADGTRLETDLIVFSAGIRPRDEVARAAGLEIAERGGITIDGACRTSEANVFAIGECAAHEGRVYGLVGPGYDMAKVAVDQIMGSGGLVFRGADLSTQLKLLGVEVGTVGDAQGRTPDARSYTYVDECNEVYKRLVVNQTGKQLLGAVLVGDTSDFGVLRQMMQSEITLPRNPETLIVPSSGAGAGVALGIDSIAASAQICSCHNVSKQALVDTIQAGTTTLAGLQAQTKAMSGCGGCKPLVGQLLGAELEKLGIEVSTDLCEHFPHTRQELYHLVRVEDIRSFDDLIRLHGKGMGCDVCKPAVASILASCWNGHVLAPNRAGLQDTNDHFLANMQKNGTYSIVPRIPGGEITPTKLIALGEVAERYDLYTKITGGQRIDLFGAEVHQLPEIWRELIDAGFETGHAYGKAVRTVKSCVGSTWCRYGVLDSVAMAIDIENRYKGLRAPHKLKFAVSGCTRECAEAQSKDVGVIATEGGWNLFVGGNGGMRPRHADLFATGLDDGELIRTIDRFLMFYIRTADRLQRTSVWLESLDGGLDYLRSVVIDDSLGIAADLEREMAHVVATYECEWRATIDDEAKLTRFRTFVNSDAADESIVFVRERGQRRPARAEEVA